MKSCRIFCENNRKFPLKHFLLILLFTSTITSAREWTAVSGHRLTGDFVSCENGSVAIKTPDGKIADVPLEQLCEDDKNFVKQEMGKKNNPFMVRQPNPASQIETAKQKEEEHKKAPVSDKDAASANVPFEDIRSGQIFDGFSPDGRSIVLTKDNGGGSKIVSTVFDIETKKPIFRLLGYGVHFSPDGKYIAGFYQDWEGRDYQQRYQRWKKTNSREARQGIRPMSFMWLKMYDAQTGQEIRKMQEVENNTFAFSADGKSYMVDDYLWETATGKKIRKLQGQGQFVSKELEDTAAAQKPKEEWASEGNKVFSLDGKFCAVENSDAKTVTVFETETGKALYKIADAYAPHLSPNGRYLLHSIQGSGTNTADKMRLHDLKSLINTK